MFRQFKRTHRKLQTKRDKEETTPLIQHDNTPDVKKIISLYKANPKSEVNQQNVMQLQRTLGNQTVMSLLGNNSLQREETEETDKTKETSKSKDTSTQNDNVVSPKGKDYEDFDGKQFRITGKAPDRKVQEVKRMTTVDGDVYYVALGEVVSFEENKPVVKYYKTPVDLGDWYPSVTHVNGMAVQTQEGIEDAMLLQQTINEKIEKNGDDIALGQDAIDVLYTYSATSGMFFDVINCIKGKFGYNDQVIKMQTQMMVDAVTLKHKTHISAHSRGTIKTDNAVRNAFDQLTQHFIPLIKQEIEGSLDIDDDNMKKIQYAIRDIAKARAGEEMDKYIHLIYAGNAVEFPSSKLPVEFVVGSYDAVSILFGTYTKWGTKNWFGQGHDDSTMKDQSSGHSFKGYIPNVADIIGKDIVKDHGSKG